MKMDFESSKYVTWIGVTAYFGLQGLLWCWKRWVEKGEVFSGKRRRMVKRVSSPAVCRQSGWSILLYLNCEPRNRNRRMGMLNDRLKRILFKLQLQQA